MRFISKRICAATIVLVCFCLPIHSQPNYPAEPEMAQLIYTDIEHFIEAFGKLEKGSDTLSVLKTYYFDRGSAGLKEYITRHNLTPEALKSVISKDPERYGRISEFLEKIPSIKSEYTQTMKEFHKVVPDAMYPPTYLLVGANRGIAQASRAGQLVTITRILDDHLKLKKLMVHELAHFQQAKTMGPQKYGVLYSENDNMLGLCLREGGAEFITFLVLGEVTQSKALAYYREHENELRSKFKKDLSEQATDFWLWESVNDPETPQLLGYVIGYEICKAYFTQAEDKSAALQQILVMDSPLDFLDSSGYHK